MCECKYVGRTFRNFQTIIKEHINSLQKNYHVSKLNYDPKEFVEILHVRVKGNTLNSLEELEVKKLTKWTLFQLSGREN